MVPPPSWFQLSPAHGSVVQVSCEAPVSLSPEALIVPLPGAHAGSITVVVLTGHQHVFLVSFITTLLVGVTPRKPRRLVATGCSNMERHHRFDPISIGDRLGLRPANTGAH